MSPGCSGATASVDARRGRWWSGAGIGSTPRRSAAGRSCAVRRSSLSPILRRRMLKPVGVGGKSVDDYASIAGRLLVDEIRERAERLRGKRILHVSATAFGGGVSEILYTLIPLMLDVGLECEWHV